MLRVTVSFILILAVLLASQLFAASGGSGEDLRLTYTLSAFAHQLLFVYWLGPDIGTSIWSRKVVDPALSAEQRVAAGNMMHSIDLIPRICLSLMLTVGGILSETIGVTHPLWQMIGIVLLGPVWLTMTLIVYFREGTNFGETVARLDGWFRWALVLGIIVSTSFSWFTDRLVETPWLAGKLYLLAAIIFLGMMMRRQLAGFYEGLAKMADGGASAEVDAMMAASLSKGRPFLHTIWVAMLLAAWLGVVQPGSPEEPEPLATSPPQSDYLRTATYNHQASRPLYHRQLPLRPSFGVMRNAE